MRGITHHRTIHIPSHGSIARVWGANIRKKKRPIALNLSHQGWARNVISNRREYLRPSAGKYDIPRKRILAQVVES